MKRAVSVFLIFFVLLIFAGTAFAAEISGEVTALNSAKSTFALKNEAGTTEFVCEMPALVKEVKLSDKVTVQYKEESGKKVATKITPVKKKVSVGC